MPPSNSNVLKLPKGTIKDNFLKYNLLKLLMCIIIIFGGIYFIITTYISFFSKGVFLDGEKTFETKAYVVTMTGEVTHYYNIVNEEISQEKYSEILNKIKNSDDKTFVSNSYEKKENSKYYMLNKKLTKTDYTKLFMIMESVEGLLKNLRPEYELPKEVQKGDSYNIIFEIKNPDNYTFYKKESTHNEIRSFIEKSRQMNFLFLFLTPLLPILGILWLFYSVKHTYERQKKYEEAMQKG